MFPSDSPFNQEPLPPKEPEASFPVHYVGRADTIEVPIKVFEEWLAEFEYLAGDGLEGPDQETIEGILDQMRSYLRG